MNMHKWQTQKLRVEQLKCQEKKQLLTDWTRKTIEVSRKHADPGDRQEKIGRVN